MKNAIEIVKPSWHAVPPASKEQLDSLQEALDLTLPVDYREFMLWSNGGEGKVGSAYVSLWAVEKIIARNISASIWQYISKRFIGIGTNGGDECYGLDYTNDSTSPKFVIVSLGDLSYDSKFFIAPTLTEGLQKSLDFQFDDGEYNLQERGPLTQELINIHQSNLRIKLQKLWEDRKYKDFIELFDLEKLNASPTEMRKIQLAKKFLGA